MQTTADRRNTDQDWNAIGAAEPFWGVLVQPQFKMDALTPQAVEEFYTTGDHDMLRYTENFERHFGPFRPKSALDFGCGVGRIAFAMAKGIPSVVGVDISEGMLARAAKYAASRRIQNVEWMKELPNRTFDWVNTHIVLQHIPADRGLKIIDQLLQRVNPGGWVSLHVVIYNEQGAEITAHQPVESIPPMLMCCYPLGEVIQRFHQNDIIDLAFLSTNHSPHGGLIIFGRRKEVVAGAHASIRFLKRFLPLSLFRSPRHESQSSQAA
jgi:SAM-dependent methyltransferase